MFCFLFLFLYQSTNSSLLHASSFFFSLFHARSVVFFFFMICYSFYLFLIPSPFNLLHIIIFLSFLVLLFFLSPSSFFLTFYSSFFFFNILSSLASKLQFDPWKCWKKDFSIPALKKCKMLFYEKKMEALNFFSHSIKKFLMWRKKFNYLAEAVGAHRTRFQKLDGLSNLFWQLSLKNRSSV